MTRAYVKGADFMVLGHRWLRNSYQGAYRPRLYLIQASPAGVDLNALYSYVSILMYPTLTRAAAIVSRFSLSSGLPS